MIRQPVMARSQPKLIGDFPVGSIVKLDENSVQTEFIVVHQGRPSDIYDSSCDGTWLLRKECHSIRRWDVNNASVYESSSIDTWLDNTYTNYLDERIQHSIKQAKIPYRMNGGPDGIDQNGANGLSRKVFLLSGYEIGYTISYNSGLPIDGAILDYFEAGTSTSAKDKRIAYMEGYVASWWLRSPRITWDHYAMCIEADGTCSHANTNVNRSVRPAFVLPPILCVNDDGTIIS